MRKRVEEEEEEEEEEKEEEVVSLRVIPTGIFFFPETDGASLEMLLEDRAKAFEQRENMRVTREELLRVRGHCLYVSFWKLSVRGSGRGLETVLFSLNS